MVVEISKRLFFEKKKPKTFVMAGQGAANGKG
jgi:hypothetical protein